MIIGINGKIGSGKDTIGKIIQCLINHPEITTPDLLFMINNNIVSESTNSEIKKFAGKLKTIASLLTGVPVEYFEDQEFKKQQMNPEWGMTYREFLQKLGTEAMRDGLHTNVWVNALFADYVKIEDKSSRKLAKIFAYPNWIITDMRFPNEMEAVVERKGITIRVVRPVHALSQENHCSLLHPSETSLDSEEFDYTIVNDSTIENLVEKVVEILIKEKLI